MAAPTPAAVAPQPTLPAEERRLFRRVLSALTNGGINFALAGAYAFQRYTGIGRVTKDLDLFLPSADVGRALELCRRAGLRTEIRDPVWLAKARSGRYFVDLISGMSNGAIWVTPDWIARARPAEWLGVPLRLLAPEEMILSKMFVTRRERFDGSDICHLIYCHGPDLDWHRLLAATGDHWPLLLWHLMLFQYVYPAAADKVPPPVWRRLWTRWWRQHRGGGAQRSRGRAVTAPDFRGGLIDPVMFAPDLELWGLADLEAEYRGRRLGAQPPRKAPGAEHNESGAPSARRSGSLRRAGSLKRS